MKRRFAGAAVAVAALAVILVVALIATRSQSTSSLPSARIVLVSRTMPSLSMPGQPLHVKLLFGNPSSSAQAGVVLADKQCQADSAGVSRCLNTIRLASGETIAVRHPHRMMDVACLTPGEHVTVLMNGA
jgi:hypothetical protein